MLKKDLTGRHCYPDDRYCEVEPGSPESLARGMLPKGFPRNPGELTIFARKIGNAGAKGNRRRLSTDGERSYEPVVPIKVGNRRAPKGAATEPTGGRGEQVHVSGESKHSRGSDLDAL